MARFDAEAAWDDLQAKILERDGWGTKQLIAEMAHLRVRHRVSEGLFARFLRLYGDRLAPAASIREDSSSADGATTASGRRGDHRATEDPEEDHDERDHQYPGRHSARAA